MYIMSIPKLANMKRELNTEFCQSMSRKDRLEHLITIADNLDLWCESDSEELEVEETVSFWCEETNDQIGWYFVDEILTFDW